MTPQELEQIRKIFREELQALMPGMVVPPPAPPASDPWMRVRELAKTDPQASKDLARRLSQEDSLRRREERKLRRAA